MTWSSVTAKNCPAKAPTNSSKKVEEIPDYWNDSKFDCNWKTVETQVKESYEKLGFDVPQNVYGRPSLLDFTK